MHGPIKNSPLTGAMSKGPGPTAKGCTYADGDSGGVPLVIGVKISGEGSALLDNIGKKGK